MIIKIPFFSWIKEKFFSPHTTPKPLFTPPKAKEQYVLVLSGGGTRGFYHGGILKAIEEC